MRFCERSSMSEIKHPLKTFGLRAAFVQRVIYAAQDLFCCRTVASILSQGQDIFCSHGAGEVHQCRSGIQQKRVAQSKGGGSKKKRGCGCGWDSPRAVLRVWHSAAPGSGDLICRYFRV